MRADPSPRHCRMPLAALVLAVLAVVFAPAALAGQPMAPETELRATSLPAAVAQPVAPRIEAHPALWKLRQGATTVYLFGTVHALPPGVAWFTGPVADAFGASGELVTEIIDLPPEDMQKLVAAKALLPPGQNLRLQLNRADRKAFERSMRANGLAENGFDRFRPWYAAVALSTRPLLISGFDPARGADEELSARATHEARKHEALETPEYQLGLFAALPRATQLRYLREVVRHMPSVQRELRAMVRAWEKGDAASLARLMNEDNDDPHMRKALLVDRNRAWARWIKARLSKPGTVFVAVGAGHLAGPDSLLEQLARMGFTAVRVQ